jgi:chorismate synthase
MTKRTDFSKISLKSKKPKSIRYNVRDFEAVVNLSGRSTVQGVWDYLVAKYLAEMGVRNVAPLASFDTRPIDIKVFDTTNETAFQSELELFKRKKVVGEAATTPSQNNTPKEIDTWLQKTQAKKDADWFERNKRRTDMLKGKK